jgi:hypothetical protein
MTDSSDAASQLTGRRGLFQGYRRERETAWIQAVGGSMRPLVAAGDWILVDFGRPPTGVGEIVVFDDGSQIVAHRIVAWASSGRLVTKGDGQLQFDRTLAVDDVLGVVRARRRSDGGHPRTLGCSGPFAWSAAKLSLTLGVATQHARNR